MTSDIGAVTSFAAFVSASDHFIFMLIESLPTGIDIPSLGHRSSPTASTPSYNAAPSPGWLLADIQLADKLTLDSLSKVLAAARFINDSATAILADAAGEMRASVGFSPIAIASPVLTPGIRDVAVTETSETGTCHLPTI
jgi:hypothetical protein